MDNQELDAVVRGIADNYASAPEIFFTEPDRHFPNRNRIIDVIEDCRHLMFPGYFGDEAASCASHPEYFIGDTLMRIRQHLRREVREALLFRDPHAERPVIARRSDEIVDAFVGALPEVQKVLLTDVQAAFDGDPAAQSKEEIIFSYPGLFAIFVYRLAHQLYLQDVPLIPRIMNEYAHDHTGIDINSGADIGPYFFIDHAAGVVIGETTKIGCHVKVYQGVTLGALSTRAGQGLRGVKRHPTIGDYVTIYANASVLGGETVIGSGTVIAGSTFVTESVPENSRVTLKNQEVKVRQSSHRYDAEGFETC